MLKVILGFLVLANCAVAAYNAGYLGKAPDGREPARMTNQLNAPAIRLVDPFAPAAALPGTATQPAVAQIAAHDGTADATAEFLLVQSTANRAGASARRESAGAAHTATAGPRPAVAALTSGGLAADRIGVQCIEIGNFDAAEARRFEQQVATLALGDRVSRRVVPQTDRYIVYIPPLADRESAERTGVELRRLGINDFFVMSGSPDLRWGISLGIFKTSEAARQHLAALTEKGVQTARVGARSGSASMAAFQLRRLDTVSAALVTGLRSRFPRQEMHSCPSL